MRKFQLSFRGRQRSMQREKRHPSFLGMLKRSLYGLIVLALVAMIFINGPRLSINIVKVFEDIRIGRMDFEPEIPEMDTSNWDSKSAQKWIGCRDSLEPCAAENSIEQYNHQRIPQIIHQMYATNKIPKPLEKYVKSWTDNHETWNYMFWSDVELDNFVREKYPEHLPQYESYSYNIQRSDMARLLILHYYGGVYVDLDYFSLKPLDKLLENKTCVLTHDPDIQGLLLYHEDPIVTNAFLACSPKHPLLQLTIDSMENAQTLTSVARGNILLHLDSRWTIYMTGPLLLSRVYDDYTSKSCCLKHPEYQVELVHSDILNPLCDPAKTEFYKLKCMDLNILDVSHYVLKRLRQECRRFRLNGYRCIVGEAAFARHDWLHIGYTNQHAQNQLVTISSAIR